jgi:hypothetical protein
MRRILAFVAAAGMAATPVAASAQDASALSLAGISAPTSSGLSFFSEEGGGGSTAVILGVVLVILIGVAAISGNSGPASP